MAMSTDTNQANAVAPEDNDNTVKVDADGFPIIDEKYVFNSVEVMHDFIDALAEERKGSLFYPK